MFAYTFRLPPLRYKHHSSSATSSSIADRQKRKEQHINRQRHKYHRQDKLLDKTRETKLLEIGEQHKIEMTHQQDQLVEEGEDGKLLQRRRLDLQQDTCEDIVLKCILHQIIAPRDAHLQHTYMQLLYHHCHLKMIWKYAGDSPLQL